MVKPEKESAMRIIRPEKETLSRQNLPYFVGISADSTGATGISMNLIIIPPMSAAEPHFHRGHESAIYMMKGGTEVFYGHDLKESLTVEEGDFLFIPADMPHQPVNHTDEPVLAIVARNDANEQESVEIFHPKEDPFVTEIIDSMKHPVCIECFGPPYGRLTSPLWRCPHRSQSNNKEV